MNWIKSSTKHPPTDGSVFLALWADTPCLAEYDGDLKTYNIASIDSVSQPIKKNHNITFWCPIEKP